jgi:histidinol dehydrogenase|tara:strand:- start:10979 stop:12277 length:1299 start_codon:yes stop_codon:yes gene_type:complete
VNVYQYTNRQQLQEVLRRPLLDHAKIEKIVIPILDKVKRGGDRALKKLALEYDHVELDDLWVTEYELKEAINHLSGSLKLAIGVAKQNIWKFHELQKQEPLTLEVMAGVTCKRRSVPIRNVGLYIPGGTAPLFSTVLMLGIPALIAGCKNIILASPTNKFGQISPEVLYTAHLLGIKSVLKVGGAHAIAALAYGTESVPKVDKIFGPGNQYVMMAKQLVAKNNVAIDLPAGPSEVMIVADEQSNIKFVAADLLSQAEHGNDSQVVLVTQSSSIADAVISEINQQLETLPRKNLAKVSLSNSVAMIVNSKKEAIRVINFYGPEHLILNVVKPQPYIDKVYNAGSVFIGQYTPEAAGDYASGTNHSLPTNGWAKSYSGVSLDSFVKKITYQEITKKGLKILGPTIEIMAAAEHLEGHKKAVSIRLEYIENEKGE